MIYVVIYDLGENVYTRFNIDKLLCTKLESMLYILYMVAPCLSSLPPGISEKRAAKEFLPALIGEGHLYLHM